jgi:hypothetical protein
VAVQRFPRGSLLGLGSATQAPVGGEEARTAPATDIETRRKYPRAPYQTPVRIEAEDGAVWDGRSEDISEAGLLVVAPEGIPEKNDVEVRFALPMSGRIVTTKARPRWIRNARIGVAVGLLLSLSEDDRATIRYYVSVIRGE